MLKIRWLTIYTLGWFLLILLTNKLYSQTLSDSTNSASGKSFISSVAGDFGYVFSAPFRMQQKDILNLAGFAAVNTGFILGVDGAFDDEFVFQDAPLETVDGLEQSTKGIARLGEVYDKIGTAQFAIGLSAGMLTGGLVFKDKKLLKTTRLLIESLIITQVITTVSKGIFSRARPFTNEGPQNFNLLAFSQDNEYRSFPSGHTSSIFSMMTVIAKQYNKWWIKIPAYTFAVSVGVQRMDSRNHWMSDVFVGGSLGYWVSTMLVNRHKTGSQDSILQPYFSGNQFGLLMKL